MYTIVVGQDVHRMLQAWPGALFTKPPLITATVKATVKISVKNFPIHEAPATLRIRKQLRQIIR